MSEGFSFSCPCPESEGDAFEHFLKTARTEPSPVYNPWPQTASSTDWRRSRTQPLIRTRYLAMADPETLISAKGRLTFDHEQGHHQHDYSPAHLLARCRLSDGIDDLEMLLFGETWKQKTWNNLTKNNSELSSICRSISVSEELLATAFSFDAADEGARASQGLETLEKRAVKRYSKLYPDFEGLYYQTFKKIAAWEREDYGESGAVGAACLFVQGVEFDPENGSVRVVDSIERCRILADALKSLKNGTELANWVFQTVPQLEAHLSFTAFGAVIDRTSFSEAAQHLCTLLRGRKQRVVPSRSLRELHRSVLRFPLFVPNRIIVMLYPAELHGRWYIVPMIVDPPSFGGRSNSQREAVQWLLVFESLRQQLDEGVGIYCPHYRPSEGCACKPDWREALIRILGWAREGKFGRGGTWRDLPPECNSGIRS